MPPVCRGVEARSLGRTSEEIPGPGIADVNRPAPDMLAVTGIGVVEEEVWIGPSQRSQDQGSVVLSDRVVIVRVRVFGVGIIVGIPEAGLLVTSRGTVGTVPAGMFANSQVCTGNGVI